MRAVGCHADVAHLHNIASLLNIGEEGDSLNKLKFC